MMNFYSQTVANELCVVAILLIDLALKLVQSVKLITQADYIIQACFRHPFLMVWLDILIFYLPL